MDANIPMMGFIGRLDYQKGVDLIRDNYYWLMSGGWAGRVGGWVGGRWHKMMTATATLDGSPPSAK